MSRFDSEVIFMVVDLQMTPNKKVCGKDVRYALLMRCIL